MNEKLLLSALILTLSTGLHAAGGDAHHHHGEAAPQQLQLNAGKQWATDATLRQTMNEINQAMGKALPLIHGNRFPYPAVRFHPRPRHQSHRHVNRGVRDGAHRRGDDHRRAG